MRQIITIALMQLRLTFKSKASVLIMFGLPLVLSLVFGVAAGGGGDSTYTIPTAVIDNDRSFASQEFIKSIDASDTLATRAVANEDEMLKLFADKKVFTALIIPAGFEKAIAGGTVPEVKMIPMPGSNLNVGVGPFVRRELNRVVQDVRMARAMVSDPGDQARVKEAYDKVSAERKALSIGVTTQTVEQAEAKQADGWGKGTTTLGFTVMFVMMMVMMNAGVILRERENGTWGRLLTTPTSKFKLLAGYLLGFYLTGLTQFAILSGAEKLLFGIYYGPLLQLFVVASATILCAIAIGLFLAGIVKTHNQQTAIGILFINVTSMLGGLYWPLEYVSPVMQRIGYFTPQAWAMDAFREIMLRGGAWVNLGWPLAVLASVTVIFLSAGLLRVRYE